MITGFTGSRGENNGGMTAAQRRAFASLLTTLPVTELHHGACVGGDADAVRLASYVGTRCVAHPGRSAHDAPDGPRPDRDADAVRVSAEVRPELTHFARNRAIVDACVALIAAPSYSGPITKATKGGTAMTVNYARKMRRLLIVVWPDGTVTEERDGVSRTVAQDGVVTFTWEV